MAVTDFGKNEGLDAIAAIAGFASLHDGDPGTTGLNELSASPYARQAVVWDPATGGVVSFDGSPVIFDVVGGDSADYGGLWDASSGGNFIGGDALSNPHTFGVTGTYELTTISISA